LAAAVTVTVPLPDPLPPLIESHVALSDAVHVQPAGAVTVTAPLPPPATMFCVAGESATLQGTPAWVTVTAWPPTVTVALRDALKVFAVAVSVTVPFPEPLAPPVTVNHAALLDAVHAANRRFQRGWPSHRRPPRSSSAETPRTSTPH
jgi:hypothetical protein